jgi:hypothetical protein
MQTILGLKASGENPTTAQLKQCIELCSKAIIGFVGTNFEHKRIESNGKIMLRAKVQPKDADRWLQKETH